MTVKRILPTAESQTNCKNYERYDIMSNLPVVIKSFKDGIRFIIDKDCSFEDILKEIENIFSESKHFFGDAAVAVSFDGRELTDEEEVQILSKIRANCDLNVLCIVCDDEARNQHYLKAVKHMMDMVKPQDTGHFYRGSVTDGQVLDYDDGIVILGDVNPGCVVKSSGSIIVLGGLYGEAHAGVDFEDTDAFVIALEMSAEAVSVGPVTYTPDTKPKWGFRKKLQPKIAYLKDNELVFDALNRSVLESVYAI